MKSTETVLRFLGCAERFWSLTNVAFDLSPREETVSQPALEQDA